MNLTEKLFKEEIYFWANKSFDELSSYILYTPIIKEITNSGYGFIFEITFLEIKEEYVHISISINNDIELKEKDINTSFIVYKDGTYEI